jgi:hypothetical protein
LDRILKVIQYLIATMEISDVAKFTKEIDSLLQNNEITFQPLVQSCVRVKKIKTK